MILNGEKGFHINSNLFDYRIHNENMSSDRRLSIISYGHKLLSGMLSQEYTTNLFHPYQLKL